MTHDRNLTSFGKPCAGACNLLSETPLVLVVRSQGAEEMRVAN